MQVTKKEKNIIGSDLKKFVEKERQSCKRVNGGWGIWVRNEAGKHFLEFEEVYVLIL